MSGTHLWKASFFASTLDPISPFVNKRLSTDTCKYTVIQCIFLFC